MERWRTDSRRYALLSEPLRIKYGVTGQVRFGILRQSADLPRFRLVTLPIHEPRNSKQAPVRVGEDTVTQRLGHRADLGHLDWRHPSRPTTPRKYQDHWRRGTRKSDPAPEPPSGRANAWWNVRLSRTGQPRKTVVRLESDRIKWCVSLRWIIVWGNEQRRLE